MEIVSTLREWWVAQGSGLKQMAMACGSSTFCDISSYNLACMCVDFHAMILWWKLEKTKEKTDRFNVV